MEFELKLDMYNAEQEAVWLNDFIREHDLDDLETQVKEAEPEPGTMDGGILLPTLAIITGNLVVKGIEWLFVKLQSHFQGKKGRFTLTRSGNNGEVFSMTFTVGSDEEVQKAKADFRQKYAQYFEEN